MCQAASIPKSYTYLLMCSIKLLREPREKNDSNARIASAVPKASVVLQAIVPPPPPLTEFISQGWCQVPQASSICFSTADAYVERDVINMKHQLTLKKSIRYSIYNQSPSTLCCHLPIYQIEDQNTTAFLFLSSISLSVDLTEY